ncbi:DUF4252 domain-containing protein [Psychroflexus montanilacus]|uniref:DUF4252 domain-containing protein n=1 Tax=Psychroflexus montanilacus TaxID=2873598 RepID=UPI001CCF21E5|nr:DUF4252 domain-containing protein [Psychroflexus montanilacus]MBZ9650834.1 DUF4252 domain-containing protein [Psychroflexus montanilacus]
MYKIIFLLVGVISLISCNNQQSLQEYLVEKENSTEFITASVPTSLLFQNLDSLSSKEKSSLQKIEKINLLALTKKKGGEILEKERKAIRQILANSNYESLINFNGGAREARFVFSGTESKIDELIFFGFDEEMGLIVLRMRGSSVDVNDIYQISQSAQQMDMSTISEGFGDLMGEFN